MRLRTEMKTQVITVNPQIEKLSIAKLRAYKKELKFLLEQAETYCECPRHAVQGLRDQLVYIDKRLKRRRK